MVQHISDRSHAQVSIHDNLDPSGRLVVMEFVTASLEGQEAILPAEMKRVLKMGVEWNLCQRNTSKVFSLCLNRWFVGA
jgi:hypothetical protein